MAPLDAAGVRRKHENGEHMAESSGNWSLVEVAGHRCRVFEPAQPSPHDFVVIYLHCSESCVAARLSGVCESIRSDTGCE